MIWALCSAATAVYWVLSWAEGNAWFRSGVKGLAVAPLAIWIWPFAPVAALALALCSLGDVVLSRPGEPAFLGGLIAFALGHLAWIWAFHAEVGLTPTLLGEVNRGIALLAITLLAVFMLKTLVPRAGTLAGPVALYIAIIIAMGIAALATPSGWLITGAAFFMLSDTLLGLQTFALEKGTPRERWVNTLIWPLYWAAIVLMTLGVLS